MAKRALQRTSASFGFAFVSPRKPSRLPGSSARRRWRKSGTTQGTNPPPERTGTGTGTGTGTRRICLVRFSRRAWTSPSRRRPATRSMGAWCSSSGGASRSSPRRTLSRTPSQRAIVLALRGRGTRRARRGNRRAQQRRRATRARRMRRTFPPRGGKTRMNSRGRKFPTRNRAKRATSGVWRTSSLVRNVR